MGGGVFDETKNNTCSRAKQTRPPAEQSAVVARGDRVGGGGHGGGSRGGGGARKEGWADGKE